MRPGTSLRILSYQSKPPGSYDLRDDRYVPDCSVGFKASCILINEREPGYLGTMPPHDPELARRLIADLGLGPSRSRGMTTFDYGIYPDQLVVGAYDGAAVIGGPNLIDSFEPMGRSPLIPLILRTFPLAAVLSVSLHSVVNLFNYAYFEKGKLLRAYGGDADSGVVVDVGEWLPEERAHFERSVVRDGKRYFYADIGGKTAEFSAEAYGETLAFEVMARFLGCRLGRDDPQIDPLELPMESFDRDEPRKWWWPFQRVSAVEGAFRPTLKSPLCLVCGDKPVATGRSLEALCPTCSCGCLPGSVASTPKKTAWTSQRSTPRLCSRNLALTRLITSNGSWRRKSSLASSSPIWPPSE